MKSSELLKEVRYRIFSGGHTYICNAIGYVSADNWIYFRTDQARAVKAEIKRKFAPYPVLQDWLEYVAKIPSDQLTPENMRAYRLRWLDHLIGEYESKGD